MQLLHIVTVTINYVSLSNATDAKPLDSQAWTTANSIGVPCYSIYQWHACCDEGEVQVQSDGDQVLRSSDGRRNWETVKGV